MLGDVLARADVAQVTDGRKLPRRRGGSIAVPFARAADPDELERLAGAGADFFELRIDLAGCDSPEDAERMAASFGGRPLICACRSAAEGGRGGADHERLMMLAATVRHAHALDVELSSPQILPQAALLASENGCELVVSLHFLDGTPDLGDLEELAEQAAAAGAGVIKVAATCSGDGDVDTLAELLRREREKGRDIAVMGMGDSDVAAESRVRLAKLGSVFVFARAELESAPGQPGLKWLAERLDRPG